MRAWAALLCAAGALTALVPSSDAAAPSCNRTRNVTMGDDAAGNVFFSRSRVTIRAGSCVRWIWTGALEHELEGRNLNSPPRAAPYRFKKRYARARERPFSVICRLHPVEMRMRVKVLPPPA